MDDTSALESHPHRSLVSSVELLAVKLSIQIEGGQKDVKWLKTLVDRSRISQIQPCQLLSVPSNADVRMWRTQQIIDLVLTFR